MDLVELNKEYKILSEERKELIFKLYTNINKDASKEENKELVKKILDLDVRIAENRKSINTPQPC